MPPPSRLSAATRWLSWASLGLLTLTGLWALLFQLRLPSRLPSEEDFLQLGQQLAQQAQPGDVVLLFPWWTERARLFVPDGLPVVGYLGSDADPLTAHPRIWVVSQPELPGNRRSEFEAAFLPQRTVAVPEARFGHLRLTGYQNGRHRPVVFTLSEVLSQTRVFIEDPQGARVPCSPVGQGFRCGNRLSVNTEWHEARSEPRRCIFLTPPGKDRSLVLELPPLPDAQGWSLEAGHIWDRGWHHGPQLTPSTIRLEDGERRTVADLILAVGLEGFHRTQVEALPSGPLRLTVQSPNPELRELCLDLIGHGASR